MAEATAQSTRSFTPSCCFLLRLVAFRGLQRLSPLYGGDQLVEMLGILKPGSQFIAVTDQATYGRKQDFLQRQIKFLPRHFIEILENKQVINWVQI